MPKYIETAEIITVPVIPLRAAVAFPGISMNFTVPDECGAKAVEAAEFSGGPVLLLSLRKFGKDTIKETDFYKVGTTANIKQSFRENDNELHVVCEGISRAHVISVNHQNGYFTADVLCKEYHVSGSDETKDEAYLNEARKAFMKVMKFFPALVGDVSDTVNSIDDPGFLADFIGSSVIMRPTDKQKLLACYDPYKRVEALIVILSKEAELLETELQIQQKVREKLNDAQKEHYLREQLRVIEEELGEGDSDDEYYPRIIAAGLPREIEEKLLKENERLIKTQYGSAEAGVLRNYLDVCLDLPWKKSTSDRLDLDVARKILEAEHDGLEKIKTRILEFIAVKKLNPELKNQIICLVGPPGTGKTSIAKSIAHAMNRKYVRISLGGVRDEADIRGHRKTYVGAMPGRIIAAITQAKVSNPLLLLDEIDKVGNDSRGDPCSALLEVLDPEQNKYFRDHFVELPFDLSECLFVCTANNMAGIPKPLLDRMEIIELTSYTRREKLLIAKHHLIPKQIKRHGMSSGNFRITDDAIIELIDYYTRESGVRNLEREIASVCRKAAMKLVDEGLEKVVVEREDIGKMLGHRKIVPENLSTEDEIGVVNGLAYTEVGGDLLKIEVAVLDGTGKLELTGSLGDVMKESAHAAVSYIRAASSELGISPDFYRTKDIHIHVPEGAVPKDGPSAGVTMMTALASALTGRGVKHDVAMTGEITLRGRVLAIGGLREKTMAAYAAGIKTVVIPADNVGDLDDIDPEAREHLDFIPVRSAGDVLAAALCQKDTAE